MSDDKNQPDCPTCRYKYSKLRRRWCYYLSLKPSLVFCLTYEPKGADDGKES